MGTGTVALSCIEKGLPFIGSDIGKESFNCAVGRVREKLHNITD